MLQIGTLFFLSVFSSHQRQGQPGALGVTPFDLGHMSGSREMKLCPAKTGDARSRLPQTVDTSTAGASASFTSLQPSSLRGTSLALTPRWGRGKGLGFTEGGTEQPRKPRGVGEDP